MTPGDDDREQPPVDDDVVSDPAEDDTTGGEWSDEGGAVEEGPATDTEAG